MSECIGDLAVTAKVDHEMHEFLEAESRQFGMSRSELLRNIFDMYRESRREQLSCPHCSDAVVMDVRA